MEMLVLLLFLRSVDPFPLYHASEEGPDDLRAPINDGVTEKARDWEYDVTEKARFKDYDQFITGPTDEFPEDDVMGEIQVDFGSRSGVKPLKPGKARCKTLEERIQLTDSGVAEEIRYRVNQLTSRYGRLRSYKPLVRHQLQTPTSFLRKLLGNIGQDPTDTGFIEGYPEMTRNIPLNFISALNNVAGQTGSVLGYLLAFGYLPEVMGLEDSVRDQLDEGEEVQEDVQVSPCQLEDGIREFQKFNGLEETGQLDKATVKKLKAPRCGMKDLDSRKRRKKSRRHRRFVKRQRSWRSKTKRGVPLTYKVLNCTSSLAYEDCKSEMGLGFKRWTEVAPISFKELDPNSIEEADFTIFFVSGEHPKKDTSSLRNDDPFDGPGGVIGHAYFPRGGVIHLDNDETFTARVNSGINLRYVSMHEMGHALGLEHSRTPGAVMAPSYNKYVDDYNRQWIGADVLQADDVAGIRSQYGVGKGNVETLTGILT